VRPSEEERKEAGARLRAAREAMGLTQTEAADRADIPQSRLSEWERGDRIPSWPTLAKIAATLKLDPAILLPELFLGPAVD
jgi:transcriptional regulator with XRE-family HTH domain